MQIRDYFPFFNNHPDIVYLDSAASSQKPQIVIDEISKYLTKVSNPGRTAYGLSMQAQTLIEKTRVKVANFFGTIPHNLAFTSGTTDGVNIIIESLAKNILENEDEVLLCGQDHKASILPWLNLVLKMKKLQINIKIKHYKLNPFTGLINVKDLLNQVTEKTKFVILTHSHNVFGVVNPIAEITKMLPKKIITILDIAQTVGHISLNFNNLNVDLAVFSGHKMFSLEGVGGLIASNKVKKYFQQIKFGGGVETDHFPYILEVGTKNTAGIISLGAGVDFIQTIGIIRIQNEVEFLTQNLLQRLQKLNKIEFMPGIAYNSKLENTGIICFKPDFEIEKLEHLFDQNNINLRIGKHCVQGLKQSVRVSLHAYNNLQDIDFLCKTIENSIYL